MKKISDIFDLSIHFSTATFVTVICDTKEYLDFGLKGAFCLR